MANRRVKIQCKYWVIIGCNLTDVQEQMLAARENEHSSPTKEVRLLCKEFGFTAGLLKGALAVDRKLSHEVM